MGSNQNKASKQWIPYIWPWTNPQGTGYHSVRQWVLSRKFSLLYLLIVWYILATLGFAPRRNCDEGTWQMMLQCEWMMWMGQFKTDFWHFMATGLTTAWFHNDFVHILFVTLFGFMFPVQSFESQHGTKATMFIYFFTYLLIGLFFGGLFNILQIFWPDTHFVSYGFARAWMGGSVGIFALIGGLSYFSPKKWFLFSLVFVFEVFNHFVLGNNIHISFIHVMSTGFGWLQCWIWNRFILMNQESIAPISSSN
ncbi:MAG: hypothetical protein ABJH98_13640 [Reichenbachiella sp.]|uniref:hypothetical protein n=1 Tax=Reichenbachiella sp. TaxID=2184521 RepID=UPI00329876EC